MASGLVVYRCDDFFGDGVKYTADVVDKYVESNDVYTVEYTAGVKNGKPAVQYKQVWKDPKHNDATQYAEMFIMLNSKLLIANADLPTHELVSQLDCQGKVINKFSFSKVPHDYKKFSDMLKSSGLSKQNTA